MGLPEATVQPDAVGCDSMSETIKATDAPKPGCWFKLGDRWVFVPEELVADVSRAVCALSYVEVRCPSGR